MVIKTETSSFAENRIYPGRGIRFVRKDGNVVVFGTHKEVGLYDDRKKPAKLRWTQAWRRLNKKANVESEAKKKRTKVRKVVRSVVGLSASELQKKRAVPRDVRRKEREAAVKDLGKDKKAKKSGATKARRAVIPAAKPAAKFASKNR